MYKEIFKLVVAIISQPGKAWDILTRKEEKDDEFLSRFVYPLIGFVTVAAFLGVLFTRKEFDVELALKSSIRTLVAAFGGFYLASYLLNEIWQGWFKREKDMKLCQRFVGYSSSLMFALNIVLMLLPEFFFLRIFVLYTFYIVCRAIEECCNAERLDARGNRQLRQRLTAPEAPVGNLNHLRVRKGINACKRRTALKRANFQLRQRGGKRHRLQLHALRKRQLPDLFQALGQLHRLHIGKRVERHAVNAGYLFGCAPVLRGRNRCGNHHLVRLFGSCVSGNANRIAVNGFKGQRSAVLGRVGGQPHLVLPTVIVKVGGRIAGFARGKGQKAANSQSRRQKFSEFHDLLDSIPFPFARSLFSAFSFYYTGKASKSQ